MVRHSWENLCNPDMSLYFQVQFQFSFLVSSHKHNIDSKRLLAKVHHALSTYLDIFRIQN